MHATGTVSINESPLPQMGDGGNIEGLYQTYVDQPGACPYNATTAKSSVASYQVPYAPSSMSCAARCSGIQPRLCLDRIGCHAHGELKAGSAQPANSGRSPATMTVA